MHSTRMNSEEIMRPPSRVCNLKFFFVIFGGFLRLEAEILSREVCLEFMCKNGHANNSKDSKFYPF